MGYLSGTIGRSDALIRGPRSDIPPHDCHHFLTTVHLPFPSPDLFILFDMSDQSASSRFQALFEPALQDYENQTGISLPRHPLAEQLQNCDSVDSVMAVLQQQARAFREFRGSHKIMKSLNGVVSVLSVLSSTISTLGGVISLVCRRVLMCILRLFYTYPIVIPSCQSNTHRPRHPTRCMCLTSVVLIYISV